MTSFQTFLLAKALAAFLCSLVAGFLFAFAAVVVPGIRTLDDDHFLRAFQVMDRVIQNGQTLFVVVWVGSVLALIAATALGVWALSATDRVLIIAAALLYVFGVRLPTVAVNIPLNNAIQTLDVGSMDCAGGFRASLEPLQLGQDRGREPRIPAVDASASEGVTEDGGARPSEVASQPGSFISARIAANLGSMRNVRYSGK